MKTKNCLQYLLIAFACISAEMKAEYSWPFIIQGENGYADIHEEPDEKSKIIRRIYKYKHQLLFLNKAIEYDNERNEIIKNCADSAWIPVFAGRISGYIYKENILQINELPYLDININFDESTATGIIIGMNDSIRVSMEIVPIETIAYMSDLKRRGQHRYGDPEDEYSCPTKKLNKIIIEYNGRKTLLPEEEFQNYYYEVREMNVAVGSDGELYITFTGGKDSVEYTVWITIMNDNILSEFVEPK
jgi:hypothetical protein